MKREYGTGYYKLYFVDSKRYMSRHDAINFGEDREFTFLYKEVALSCFKTYAKEYIDAGLPVPIVELQYEVFDAFQLETKIVEREKLS
jgi:hypothetical protein